MVWDQSRVITLGGGLTSDMPSPEGPWMCVHACVGVSMTDNKSKRKTFEMKKVCLCEPSPDLWTGRDKSPTALCWRLLSPFRRSIQIKEKWLHFHFSSIMTTAQLGKQMHYKIICLFRQRKEKNSSEECRICWFELGDLFCSLPSQQEGGTQWFYVKWLLQ